MADIASVAATGDRAATLRALRDRLAEELDRTKSPRDVTALTYRLQDVMEQLDDLTDTEEETDDLADLIALPGEASG